MVNFTSVASDAQLPPNIVRDYYQLLQDTLVGDMLLPWTKSKKRKAIQTAKFYFFDMGVVNSLKGVEFLDCNSDLYGSGFEHFIYLELKAYLSYNKIRKPLTYWRSKNGFEVDFLIGDSVAIEVKSARKVSKRDQKGLLALLEEDISFDHAIIVSQDEVEKNYDSKISHIHFEKFLKDLWAGNIIK